MVTTKTTSAEGFEPIFHTPNFKCAFITQSPQYDFGKVKEMKKAIAKEGKENLFLEKYSILKT